jgi:polyisoprenoid-binding protein YceI
MHLDDCVAKYNCLQPMINKLTWEIAPKNSLLQFKTKWFGISSIAGQFSKFHAIVKADQFFSNPEIHLLIETGSAETPDEKWNKYLRASEFLAAESFPYIEFASVGGCRQQSGKIWELTGDLSIKGTTKSLTMIVNLSDIIKEKKKTTAVFHLFGTISRKDFALHCPQEEDIADEVQLNAIITLTSIEE